MAKTLLDWYDDYDDSAFGAAKSKYSQQFLQRIYPPPPPFRDLMCVGGPHSWHMVRMDSAQNQFDCSQFYNKIPLTRLSYRSITSTLKAKVYRVERTPSGKEFLVYHTLGREWIDKVVEQYARRNRRKR